jgi:hypothetical protein
MNSSARKILQRKISFNDSLIKTKNGDVNQTNAHQKNYRIKRKGEPIEAIFELIDNLDPHHEG